MRAPIPWVCGCRSSRCKPSSAVCARNRPKPPPSNRSFAMATAIAQPATTTATRVKWLPLLLAIALGLALYFMPAQPGLTRAGQTALAITAFTIVLWAFGVMNNGVASVLMMALLIPAGAKPALALSGVSSGSWWILLAVLYYGFVMQKTGLAALTSYYILSLFPASYSGILAAFFLIGTGLW